MSPEKLQNLSVIYTVTALIENKLIGHQWNTDHRLCSKPEAVYQ